MSGHMTETEKRLIAYHLGELSPEERSAVEAELAVHPEWAEEYGDVISKLKDWAGEPVPSSPLDLNALNEAIAAAERENKAEQPKIEKVTPLRRVNFWNHAGTRALVAALAVIAVSAGIIAHRLSQESVTPLPEPQPQPEITKQQLTQARQQLEFTFAYIGQVGGRSAATVVEEAVATGVVPPLQKAAKDVLDTPAEFKSLHLL